MKGDTQQENDDKKYIGNRLRILREQRGWSQEKLAAMMGDKYNRKMIAQYENGEDHMRMGALFAACEALNVSLGALVPSRLLSDTDNMLTAFHELTPENRAEAVRYTEYLLLRQRQSAQEVAKTEDEDNQ
ncbi:MAG: helix-turn-helix transcriptional regulator [Oscillibacter sp.]|nr:helix-turn-helix transcriptional regulator [Oscillibacter sp.]